MPPRYKPGGCPKTLQGLPRSLFLLGKSIGTGIAPKPKNRERWGAAAEVLSRGRESSHFTRAFEGSLGELLRVPGEEDAGDSTQVLKWIIVGG